jgi:4-methyl-5(b-hydroxyethyl)-thiazole monophosphate biosynthesis
MPGAQHLHDCKELQQLLIKQNTDGKLISAICAAPAVVLAPLGILSGKSATCYPAPKFRDVIKSNYLNENAVISDSNVITSQGPGTSLKFSLKLVEVLFGLEMSQNLAKEMCADI